MSWFLSRLLFFFTSVLAFVLAGLVMVAPWLFWLDLESQPWAKLLRLFAEDRIVRRTALASALGLFVTAWVFFRPAKLKTREPGRESVLK